MKSESRFSRLEELIAHNSKFSFTIVSFVAVLMIYVNLTTIQSPLVGIAATIIFFLVNGTFLGRTFFERESLFQRLMLGCLLLIALVGLVSWGVMIIHNLDVLRATIALIIVTVLISILNRWK